MQYAMLNCGYVDAIAAHEAAILQYMQDCNANFRILEEPLLVTGIGVAFALNDTRGLDEKLTETFAAMRADGTMKQIVGKYLPDRKNIWRWTPLNRNKKTFTPNMRVAALYLLMGMLLLLAVTLFSGRESMRATEEYFDRTINFVKVQSTSYEKYNDTITAKSLRRMAVSVRQLAENDALDIYDPESPPERNGIPLAYRHCRTGRKWRITARIYGW